MPSETYGRTVLTQIFRSFHGTPSFSTGGWIRCNISICFLYIIPSSTVLFLDLKDAILSIQDLLFFFVYISIFSNCTLHVCYVFYVICRSSASPESVTQVRPVSLKPKLLQKVIYIYIYIYMRVHGVGAVCHACMHPVSYKTALTSTTL